MTTKDNTVLRHPNFDSDPVDNPSTGGRKKGVPSLAMARRKKKVDASHERPSYFSAREAAMQKAMDSPDREILSRLRELKKVAASVDRQLFDLEEMLLNKHDPNLETLGNRRS